MKLEKKFKSIIFENIKYSSEEDKFKILDIRNEEKIRKQMFNNYLISKIDHKNWLKNFDVTKKNFFYCIKYDDKIIGGLGLNLLDEAKFEFDWSFYITQKEKLLGLGTLTELKALDYFFDNYKIQSLFCYVFKKNKLVLKLHKKFGFIETNFKKKFNIPNYISNNDIVFLKINKDQWNMKKKMLYNNLIKL